MPGNEPNPAAAEFFREAKRRLDALWHSSNTPDGVEDGLDLGPAGLTFPSRPPETQWAQILAVDLGHPYPRHAWREFAHDPSGLTAASEPIPGGGYGTTEHDWAEEANGSFAEPGDLVLLRRDKFGRWLFQLPDADQSGSGGGGAGSVDIEQPYNFRCRDDGEPGLEWDVRTIRITFGAGGRVTSAGYV